MVEDNFFVLENIIEEDTTDIDYDNLPKLSRKLKFFD